jgi:transcriptional regulator with XRE-family HTH domain
MKPWAIRIRNLRKTLGMTQVDFAVVAGTSQVCVSEWERGEHEPVPHSFTRLAAIAADTDKLFFLKMAGLPPSIVDGTEDLALTGKLLDQLRSLEKLRPNCTQIARDLGVTPRHVRRVYLGRAVDLIVLEAIQKQIRRRVRQGRG